MLTARGWCQARLDSLHTQGGGAMQAPPILPPFMLCVLSNQLMTVGGFDRCCVARRAFRMEHTTLVTYVIQDHTTRCQQEMVCTPGPTFFPSCGQLQPGTSTSVPLGAAAALRRPVCALPRREFPGLRYFKLAPASVRRGEAKRWAKGNAARCRPATQMALSMGLFV